MQWIATGHAPSPALVDRFYRRIFVKLHHGLQRSRADAEDATQVVFLELTQRWRDIRTSPRQYAYGIARHGTHRHAARRRRAGAEVATEGFDDVPTAVPSAPEVVEVFDDVARLVTALGELPLEDQRCLAWVYGRELKNVEAAARLGLPVVTFNNRLRGARGRLREAMLRAELRGGPRPRTPPTFAQWVDAVLGDRDAHVARSSGPPLGNRAL